ncbi:MAG: hypothetical protein P1Q69_16925, partial [Candidatus Thorarchaeota archaeon]|nr:hypothetical protein [Candidatus Thorarchaeota archaeon]
MVQSLLPSELIGHFLGVGSLVESKIDEAMEYVLNLRLPYTYQTPSIQEEDMIRQFGSLLDDFEKEGTFIFDADRDIFTEMIQDTDALLPYKSHFHTIHNFIEYSPFSYLKTQLTAPASMCYSIRDSGGNQHLTPQMFRFFASLMSRIAKGYVNHFRDAVGTLMVCLDDPAMGFVIDLIDNGKVPGLVPRQVMGVTDQILPDSVVPIYHYCYDWRILKSEGIHLLWESKPKIAHLDMVAYPPDIDSEQAELVNKFIEAGGGIALGVLPNTDAPYDNGVLQVFEESLLRTLKLLQKSGVDLALLQSNAMVSTQCGLSGGSPEISREIHNGDEKYPQIVDMSFKSL